MLSCLEGDNRINLNRGAARQSGDAYGCAGVLPGAAEHLLHQIRRAIGDFGLIGEIGRAIDEGPQLDDPLDLLKQASLTPLVRDTLPGKAIRYGDWLLPGVIGMNLMFSGLFGVGFVIVRYRKNGVLKRLRATPLSAAEFLCAQLLSRVLITLVVSLLVFLVAYWLLDVPLLGSGWLLLFIALVGGTAMASLGLLIAARIQNEELASGLLNVISMPMILDRGVDAISAGLASMRLVSTQTGVMLLWAALISGLILLALLPGFLGLLIVGPVLGHASWHAYRAVMPAQGVTTDA